MEMTEENIPKKVRKVKIGGREFKLPGSRRLRIILGALLLAGGVLGFLPVLGFWMVPLGLLILSADIALARRIRRRFEVMYSRWRRRKPDK